MPVVVVRVLWSGLTYMVIGTYALLYSLSLALCVLGWGGWVVSLCTAIPTFNTMIHNSSARLRKNKYLALSS